MRAEIAKSFYKLCTITLVFVALASTELLAKKQSSPPPLQKNLAKIQKQVSLQIEPQEPHE